MTQPQPPSALGALPPAIRWGAPPLLALLLLAVTFGWPAPVSATLALMLGFLIGWLLGRDREIPRIPPVPTAPDATPEVQIGALVEALDIPAMVLDDLRRVLAYNRHAANLFPSIARGQPLSLITRNPDLIQSIERVSERGRADTTEITERMLQGRRFIVSSSPMPAAQMLLLQFRDTSEQARLAQLRSDFIANASHELRTPLASIKGFIETLQGPARHDEAAWTRFLPIMEAQAGRMNRILDDLLSLSRIEMRAHLRPEGEVDVVEVVGQVIRGLEPLAREAEIRLTFLPTTNAERVRGDEDEIEQVMQNLIHNAIKYGRPGGRVEVEVARRPAPGKKRQQVTIRVTDDGPGISPEHLPRLTERFYRVENARSRERGGTGLGLAIVKHILNRHRGELEITSEVGRGSTFTVVLDALAA